MISISPFISGEYNRFDTFGILCGTCVVTINKLSGYEKFEEVICLDRSNPLIYEGSECFCLIYARYLEIKKLTFTLVRYY